MRSHDEGPRELLGGLLEVLLAVTPSLVPSDNHGFSSGAQVLGLERAPGSLQRGGILGGLVEVLQTGTLLGLVPPAQAHLTDDLLTSCDDSLDSLHAGLDD